MFISVIFMHLFHKIFNLLFQRYYNVEVRNSEAQLHLDFGDFPPIPLRSASLTREFKVVRARGIGVAYYEWMTSTRLVKSLVTEPNSLSEDFIKQVGIDNFNSLRQFLRNLNQFPKFLTRILKFLAIFNITLKKLIFLKNKTNGIGVFTPLSQDESNVLIRSIKLKSRSDEPIISHEHIHLLQHRNPEPHSRNIKFAEILLTENYATTPYCLYQLEKSEVEARLHEIVLSFYRTQRYLPSTIRSFLGFIAASSQFDWPVYEFLEKNKINYDHTIGTFPLRDSKLAEELLTILQWIKTDELRLRFLTEVLTVMYGNLLKYYGDHSASLAFLSEIPRPNYYDKLYGEK